MSTPEAVFESSRPDGRPFGLFDELTGQQVLAPAGSEASSLALAQAASYMHAGTDVTDVADRAVRCAVDLVAGTRWARLSAVTGGVSTTLASTGASNVAVEQVPSDAREQAADPLAQLPLTHSVDLDAEPAPGWVLRIPLAPTPAGTDWVLDLHAEGQPFDAGSQRLARLLAVHITVAMTAAHRHDNLRRAIASRDVIGQAKGILMQRYHLTADQAFSLLVRVSQSGNRKLYDIAAVLASTGQIDLNADPARQ